tara:strand:+ start:3145 stop:3732 length:588 start_codon:yes stop_codon:yes gene_type:complete
MLKIGITGGIGAGKSTVSRVISSLGYPVYDSDQRAKWLMSNSDLLKDEIIKLFGKKAFLNNELNRTFISNIVFKKPVLLEELNQLVHPKVASDYNLWVNENKKAALIFKEAAILIESGAYLEMDKIIVVVCSIEERINRVLSRDKITAGEIKKRMNAQLSDEERIEMADYVIDNSAGEKKLEENIKGIIDKILKS